MVIKLAANNVPSYVSQVEIAPGVQGYVISFPDGSSDTISIGDFIIESSPTSIRKVSRAEYDTNDTVRAEIAETVGRATNKALIVGIRSAPITGAQKITLSEYLCTVFVFLGDGFIQDAHDIANGKALTAIYTQARKDFVVGEAVKALAIVA